VFNAGDLWAVGGATLFVALALSVEHYAMKPLNLSRPQRYGVGVATILVGMWGWAAFTGEIGAAGAITVIAVLGGAPVVLWYGVDAGVDERERLVRENEELREQLAAVEKGVLKRPYSMRQLALIENIQALQAEAREALETLRVAAHQLRYYPEATDPDEPLKGKGGSGDER